MDALRPEFSDRVAFVTADLSTREGQAFAARWAAGETTLLFFDRYGTAVNRYHGTATEASLRGLITATFKEGETLPSPSRRSAEFDALRESLDRYNKGAKSIIDSMGR